MARYKIQTTRKTTHSTTTHEDQFDGRTMLKGDIVQVGTSFNRHALNRSIQQFYDERRAYRKADCKACAEWHEGLYKQQYGRKSGIRQRKGDDVDNAHKYTTAELQEMAKMHSEAVARLDSLKVYERPGAINPAYAQFVKN